MNKKSIYFSWFLFSLLVFTMPFFASAASFSLSPSSGAFSVGSTFDVQILLDTENQSVNLLNVNLLFPPDKLQVVSPSAGKSIIGVWTNFPNFNNQKGEINLQGGIPNGISVSKGLVSTITFRVKQTGEAFLRFGDATRIFLNDGKGTDALTNAQSAVYQFVLPPPAGPIVASETHRDQTRWYSNPNVLLRWATPLPVIGYSYVLDNSPLTVPDDIVDSTKNLVTYKNLSSGVYYFHIKALGSGNTWGGVTHFGINIDVDPPAEFPVVVEPGLRTTSHNLLVSFQTTDADSGIDHYEYKIIPLNPSTPGVVSPLFTEAQSPIILHLDTGTYDIVVRAYDKAGNFRDSSVKERIMTPLAFFATNEYVLGFLLLLLILAGYLARRTYQWHKEIEDRRAQNGLPKSTQKKLEDLEKYQKKYGALVILLVFLAGGLLMSHKAEAKSVDLTPPIVTTVPHDISNEDIFYIGGLTELANTEVVIYVQNVGTGETFSYSETADEKGNWLYRSPSLLSEGEYLIWTQARLNDLLSPPSPQIRFKVVATAIQFGASRLSYETLYLLFAIILFLALLGLSGFTAFHAKHARRKKKALLKEISEAEEAVRRGFQALRNDVGAELDIMKKMKLKGALSVEEKQKEERLLKDLEEIEKNISKEVMDIREEEK